MGLFRVLPTIYPYYLEYVQFRVHAFCLDSFAMKAVSLPDVTLGDVFRSSIPLMFLGLLAKVTIMTWRKIGLRLPALMGEWTDKRENDCTSQAT